MLISVAATPGADPGGEMHPCADAGLPAFPAAPPGAPAPDAVPADVLPPLAGLPLDDAAAVVGAPGAPGPTATVVLVAG